MKLDPRIKSVSDILTCFSSEAAKEYLGQQGYFADRIYPYQDLDKTCFGTLDKIDADEVPFKTGRIFYQFFLPESSLKPEEKKKWRPFTLDEFRAKFPLLSPVTLRRKQSEVPETFCFVGYTANGSIILGGDWCSFDVLFEDYELKNEDGWTPFGVEDE